MGLVAFPFDDLKCNMEFGGWGYSGGHQGIQLHNGGYALSKQEATSGASYQEYDIDSVSVELKVYTYDCCPSEPWDVVLYTVSLGRAQNFYVMVRPLSLDRPRHAH